MTVDRLNTYNRDFTPHRNSYSQGISAIKFIRSASPCLLAILCPLLIGCEKPAPPAAPVQPNRASSKLTIVVVSGPGTSQVPGIASGLKLLRGEWLERSGGELIVEQATFEDLVGRDQLKADLIIFPSRHLGALVDRELLRPVRTSVLESGEVAFGEIYPAIRDQVLRYGEKTYALTLGELPLMIGGNSGAEGTLDWESTPLRHTGRAGLRGTSVSSLRAVELIVRAVSYGHGRLIFDPETMKPQIASEPFQRALADVQREPNAGQGEAPWLGWPQVLDDDQVGLQSNSYSLLPLAKQVYNPTREKWIDNESTEPLAVLGLAGRSIGVSKSTRNSSSAFKLLKWLVSDEIASQLSPRSAATLWFRKTQESRSKRWLANRDADGDVVVKISKLLSSRDVFLVPRIPGIDEYLTAMEAAIDELDSSGRSVDETLANIAAKWDKITDRYGRDRQRVAYRRHLNLDDGGE